MVLKQWTNAVIGVIDKKLERFDPKWQAANGKGGLRSRYEDKTGIARHREWRGVKDTFVDYTAWLNNLLAMGKMVASPRCRSSRASGSTVGWAPIWAPCLY
jgi:hypothetical protein